LKKQLKYSIQDNLEIVPTIDGNNVDCHNDYLFDTYNEAAKFVIEILEEDKFYIIDEMAGMRKQLYEIDDNIKRLKMEME